MHQFLFVFYLTMLSAVQTMWLIYNVLERTWKEAVVVYVKVKSWHLFR
jgi:hypothetical protein